MRTVHVEATRELELESRDDRTREVEVTFSADVTLDADGDVLALERLRFSVDGVVERDQRHAEDVLVALAQAQVEQHQEAA
jgi:hypothetical protein